jgi:hypothetical protein
LTGILLKDLTAQTADSIRFGRAQFDTVGVAPIPTPLRQLVKEFVDSRRRNSPTDERRKAIRVPVELDVTILLVDETWNPRAKPLKGIAIDVTPHGIGIVTTSPVDANLAAVEVRLPADIAQILCQVVWTKDIGHGLFNSGLQFLLRFGRGTAIIATDPEPPSAK